MRRPRSTTPYVTWSIIALCGLAFLATLATGGPDSPLHLRGAMLGGSALGPDGELQRGVADGAWWRLVTSAFLHSPSVPGGVLHIGLNMWALWLFGPFVETMLGRVRFAVAYLTMAVGASIAVYWLSDPLALTVGASGAVFGLFGFALVALARRGGDVRSLLVLLAVNALFSLQSGISWQAHAGGLVIGLVLGALSELRSPAQWQFAVVTAGLWITFGALLVQRTAELTL